MSKSNLFSEKLCGGEIFHVYNQTNNKENLFCYDENQIRFLTKLVEFILPFTHVYSFNLMSNHFHLEIEVFEKEYFLSNAPKYFINSLPPGCQSLISKDQDNMDEILTNRFKAWLSGYSTYFNNNTKRKGNFFHRPFCRKKIDSIDYFKRATRYIHANSVRHGVTKKMLDHPWTSFHDIMNGDKSIINIPRLYEYFGGEENFMKYHLQPMIVGDEEKYVIEEADLFKALNKDENDENDENNEKDENE